MMDKAVAFWQMIEAEDNGAGRIRALPDLESGRKVFNSFFAFVAKHPRLVVGAFPSSMNDDFMGECG